MSPAAELAYLFHSLATEPRLRRSNFGMCYCIGVLATPEAKRLWRLEHLAAYRLWPQWSGEESYPVPAMSDWVMPGAWYNKACREDAIWMGDYGDLRKALALHLHEYFKALDAQPQPEFNV